MTELHWPNKLDEASFLKQYWQTRPLLIRKAFEPFENPLSPDELAGLALEEDVHSRVVLRENDTTWHCRVGPFQAEDLEQLPAKDWTLLVSDVEKHLPELRKWLRPFHFIPQWRIDDLMISYAPTGASVGAHIDNYDVFLLQVAGKRRWSYCDSAEVDRTVLPDLDIGVLANFEADNTFDLEPGDLLYIPPGVPHHGISLDDDCMTWSIGFRAPSHREIISDIAQHIAEQIPEEAFYSDPAILLHEHSGEISPNAVTRIREIWNSYVHPDSQAFEELAGSVLTGGGSSPLNASASQPPVAEEEFHHDTQVLNGHALPLTGANAGSDTIDQRISQVTARLLSAEKWERNSFSRLAYINQIDTQASDTTQRHGMLDKIREKVSRKTSEAVVADASTMEATHAVDDTQATLSISAESGTQHLSEMTSHAVSPALLFVDGHSLECSIAFAQLLTGQHEFDSADLMLFAQTHADNDFADALAVEYLCNANHLLPVAEDD